MICSIIFRNRILSNFYLVYHIIIFHKGHRIFIVRGLVVRPKGHRARQDIVFAKGRQPAGKFIFDMHTRVFAIPRLTRRICWFYNLTEQRALRVINNITITHRNRNAITIAFIQFVIFKLNSVLLIVLGLDIHIALHDTVTRLVDIPTGKYKHRITVLIIFKYLCRQINITIRGSVRIRNLVPAIHIYRTTPAVFKAHIIFSGIRFVLRRIGSIFIDPSYVRRPASKAIDILFRRFLTCTRSIHILTESVFRRGKRITIIIQEGNRKHFRILTDKFCTIIFTAGHRNQPINTFSRLIISFFVILVFTRGPLGKLVFVTQFIRIKSQFTFKYRNLSIFHFFTPDIPKVSTICIEGEADVIRLEGFFECNLV